MGNLAPFLIVGLFGFFVQLTALTGLTYLAHWSWASATLAAVELAVVHNYFWHERWTWRDRTPVRRLARFLRFNMANGVGSLAGNVILMWMLVGGLHVPIIAATVATVAILSVLNFLVADRWVFTPS